MTDGTPSAQRFDLADAFYRKQEQLRVALGLGDVASHPTTKGDHTELNWLHMLDAFLPRRYGVATAFVVDSDGNQSDQIDIVIHDRHFSPLLFDIGHADYIPAESVYAAFEVRPELDKTNLEYAADKIASVRRLHRTSVDVPHAGGIYKPVELKPIVGGILCRRSSWTPPFGDPFTRCLRDLARDGDQFTGRHVDIGCALEDGAFSMLSDEGTVSVDHSEAKAGLIYFVMRLMRLLQRVGSAPAIDYDAYLKSVPGTF